MRISAVTFACRDLGRMAAFYRQFGWPDRRRRAFPSTWSSSARTASCSASDTVYEPRFGVVTGGFRGFTLTIHCENEKAVFEAHAEIAEFDDVHDLESQPQHSGWGCGFSFGDPEGNIWDVAFKHGSEFDHRGGFSYP